MPKLSTKKSTKVKPDLHCLRIENLSLTEAVIDSTAKLVVKIKHNKANIEIVPGMVGDSFRFTGTPSRSTLAKWKNIATLIIIAADHLEEHLKGGDKK